MSWKNSAVKNLALAFVLLCATLTAGRTRAVSDVRHEAAAATTRDYSSVERAYVAKQLAAGRSGVSILITTQAGHAAKTARMLEGLGAELLVRDADVDFLVATVPISRLIEIARWPQITAVQVVTDEPDLLNAPVDSQAPVSLTPNRPTVSKPGIAPGPYTPRDNPYTGESSTESLQFKAANPTHDGRGVVIGGIEPIDPRVPSLAEALSLRGERIPKFAGYVMLPPVRVNVGAIPAEDVRHIIGWQETAPVTPDGRGFVVFNGQRYALPSNAGSGELRIALCRTRKEGPASELTMLWAVETGKVWICRKGETDFGAGLAVPTLPGAPVHQAMTAIEPDDPAHQFIHTLLVAVDSIAKTIGVQAGAGTHGAMCASVAAGHSFLNSRAEGVAPAAQFFTVLGFRDREFYKADLPTQIRPLLAILREPRVDLVTISGGTPNNPRRGVPEEDSAYATVVHRLARKYGKPVFWGAGNNGPDLEFDSAPRNSDDVIAVGAYTPLETWQANFGITPTSAHTLAPYSGYGPSYDGGLKPEILGLTGTLCAATLDHEHALPCPYYVRPPGGYGVSGGTSAAGPNAAGHAALLISAAKQAGVPHDPARLRIALFSTAKFLEGVEARAQGHGLVQVAQAWTALQRLEHHTPLTFTTQAPVKTAYSSQFLTPNIGQGLYERMGWIPGQTDERQITITRTSGPPAPIRYMLRWHGDSAFSSSQRSLSLPLNVPVMLPVRIKVDESRAYSAIVDLIDPAVDLAVHSVLLTVIAGEPLTAANGYSARVVRMAPRPGQGFAFVDVPTGTTALRIQVHQTRGKKITLRALMPNGQRPRTSTFRVSEGKPQFSPWAEWRLPSSDRETYDHTFERPMPGVWQFWITHDDGRGPRAYDPAESRPARAVEFTLQATAIGVEPPKRAVATEDQATVSFTNQLAMIPDAEIKPLGLASVREDERVLKPGLAPTFYEVDVESGTSKLEVSVEALDHAANVSLIVFRVTGEKQDPIVTVAANIVPGASKHLALADVEPGKYKICLDAWGRVPAEGLRVHYRERLFHPMYGKVAVVGTSGNLAPGATQTARISVETRTRPVNRTLEAEVGLFCKGCVHMKGDRQEWMLEGDLPILRSKSITSQPVPVATQSVRLSDVATTSVRR